MDFADLNSKQKSFLHSIVTYFYYKCFLDYDASWASEKGITSVQVEFQKEVKSLFDQISIVKFNELKDITKVFVDAKIHFDSPVTLRNKLVSKIGTTVYLWFFSQSLDYLLATIILTLYPNSFTKGKRNLMLLSDSRQKIENFIYPYCKQVRFDMLSISSLKGSSIE